MQKILSISLLLTLAALCVAIFIAVHRGNTIDRQTAKIDSLTADVARYKADAEESHKIIETYAEAEAQAKEFEVELINDENTDNLDVVPADYILNQLRAD